jgi:hypothetical protein
MNVHRVAPFLTTPVYHLCVPLARMSARMYDPRMPLRHRHFRISDDDWNAAVQRANEDGVVVSELIRGWLIAYGSGKMPEAPPRRYMKHIRSAIKSLEAALNHD